MKVLALQLKRIGDAILTAPALALLRAALPEARLELVLHGAAGGLAPLFGDLAATRVWRCARPNLTLLAALAGRSFDASLDFTGNDRSFVLAALARGRRRFSYARHVTGGWRRRIANRPVEASVRGLPTVDFHLALVRALLDDLRVPCPALPAPPYLTVPRAARPQDLPPRYAVIHPGTARDEKYWTTAGWLATIGFLEWTCQLQVVLTGSAEPREEAHLAPLRAAAGGRLIDLAGRLSLAQSAAVLAGAAVVVSVDSAAMHLAAQFGVPQVALFGPTNPFHWAPRHAAARILAAGAVAPAELAPDFRAAPMEQIAADQVAAAIRQALDFSG
jgi:ADP-heptose:LPS heptosyltransferase